MVFDRAYLSHMNRDSNLRKTSIANGTGDTAFFGKGAFFYVGRAKPALCTETAEASSKELMPDANGQRRSDPTTFTST